MTTAEQAEEAVLLCLYQRPPLTASRHISCTGYTDLIELRRPPQRRATNDSLMAASWLEASKTLG